jgi:hypothetical protein
MKTRCSNPKASNWKWYGARGITFAPEWASFERFLADMGEAPAGMTLERDDGDGPYCRANCRWATAQEQQNNKRNNRVVSYHGQDMTLSELARASGRTVPALWSRLERGMSPEDAATKPLRNTVACAHGALVGCRECRLERDAKRRRAKGIPEGSPPACPKGHLFTPETTKLANGWRQCRVCAREYMRAYNGRKKAEHMEQTA